MLLFTTYFSSFSQPLLVEACGGLISEVRVGPQISVPRVNNPNRPYGSGLVTISRDASITDPAQIIAIEYVQNIVDEMLSTSSNIVPIYMTIKNIVFSSTDLASTLISLDNTQINTSDPSYMPYSLYPSSLLNKFNRSDLNGGYPVADISINKEKNWHYGTVDKPLSSQYDFVTALLHEVGHALGFSAYPSISTNSYGYISNNQLYPSILDRFMVNSTGTLLTSLPTPSSQVSAFLYSIDIYFNGSNAISLNNGIKPKMYSDSYPPYKSSRSHMTGGVMNEKLSNGNSFHDFNPAGKGILKDIGWDISIVTGSGDRLYFTPCTNVWYYNQNTPGCTPLQALVNVGTSYSYLAHYEDNAPFGSTMMNRNWKIELFNSNGSMQTIYSLSTPNITSESVNITIPSIPLPPNGTRWKRNEDGSLKAKISVFGYDSQSSYKSSSIIIGINTLPDKPLLNLYSNTCGLSWSRNSAKISYYASGAVSYKLYIGNSSGNYTRVINLPIGNNTYTISSLATGYYYVAIKGLNLQGESVYCDEIVINTTCSASSRIASTQLDESKNIEDIKVYVDREILNIENVNLINSQKYTVSIVNTLGQLEKTISIDNQQNIESIDISDLQDGFYIVNITAEQKIIYNKKIVLTSAK